MKSFFLIPHMAKKSGFSKAPPEIWIKKNAALWDQGILVYFQGSYLQWLFEGVRVARNDASRDVR